MTSQQEQWGPWIEHDGNGCPCVGMWVEVVLHNGGTFEGVQPYVPQADPQFNPWNWATLKPSLYDHRVIRYRIRKPRALLGMIERAATLDDPVTAKEVVDGHPELV